MQSMATRPGQIVNSRLDRNCLELAGINTNGVGLKVTNNTGGVINGTIAIQVPAFSELARLPSSTPR